MYKRVARLTLQRLLQTRDDFTIEAPVARQGSLLQRQMDRIWNVFQCDCGWHGVTQYGCVLVVFWCRAVCMSSAADYINTTPRDSSVVGSFVVSAMSNAIVLSA